MTTFSLINKSGTVTFINGTVGGLITLARSGNIGTFSQNGVAAATTVDFTSGFVKLVVGSSQTLSATAGDLNGLAITGIGNVVVAVPAGTVSADLHLIINSGTRTAVVSDNVTFTGNLGTFTTTVIAGQTFTADAVKVAGKTITGAGNVAVTALEGTLSADLHLITNSGTKTAAFSGTATFTGNLGTFITTVASGIFTANAAKVSGKTIGGAGAVSVTALEATAAADLHLITTATNTATVSGNVTFTGNLGTFTTNVVTAKTFTATAAVVNGKTITAAGTGTVKVTALEATASADLSHITIATGRPTAAVSGNVTFTGDLGTFTTTVAATKTFTATAAVVTTKYIAGAGNVAVTALNATAAADLSHITNSGTKTAAVSNDVTFSGNLGAFTATVAASKTFTADAATVTLKTINGTGNVAVTALEGALSADLHLITNSGTKTAAFSDSATFAGNLGTFTTTVAATKTFTATAAVVSGKTIDGAGAVSVTALNATASADLSHITNTDSQTATVSGDVTFTGKLGTFTTNVVTAKTFTATAAVVNGKIITAAGTGTVKVTALEATASADLSQITAGTGHQTAAVSGNVTFTGDLGTFTTTIAATKTFTATAAVVATKYIDGAGNVAVTALNATPAADLSHITNSGTKTAAVSNDVTFSGNLGAFITTVAASKTFTADAATVTLKTINGTGNVAVTALEVTLSADLHLITNSGTKTAAFSGTATFTGNLGTFITMVNSGTFTATAAKVDGKTINGLGIVAVTALNATASADLSHITTDGTNTAAFSGNITFTGNLGTFTTTVAAGQTFTATAAVVNGKTINATDANSVAVTALNATATADLSQITTSTGHPTAAVSDNVTFTGDLGNFITTVAATKTFTATAAVVTTKYIDGAGNVAVTALNATADAILSHITNSGTRTAAVSNDVTFTGDLGTFITTVAASKTFTADAATVTLKTINGAGNVAVTALEGALSADLHLITNSGTKTAAFSGTHTFTGNLGTFITTVDSGTLTATAAKVNGKIINGTGIVAVTALELTDSADLSQITTDGINTADVADNVTFTGKLGDFTTRVATTKTFTATAAVVNGKTITGILTGSVAVTELEATASADLSHITKTNTGNLTATVSGNVTFTGDLGDFATTIAATKTFTATAAVVTTKYIDGAGNVAVTALNATAAANLSHITNSGTKTAAVSNDVTFIGDLGTFITTVAASKTFTATAAVVTGKTINGAGNVAVTVLDATPTADLSLITNSGTKTAAVSDTVIFTGDLGSFTTTVADTKTFTAAASVVNGKTITGTDTGSIAVTALEATASADLSHITTSTGDLTALVSGNLTFTGDLGAFITTVDSLYTFTATAAKVNGKTIDGTGKVAVTALQANTNLNSITTNGINTATVSDNVTFIGNLGTFTTTVAANKTFTADADKVDGHIINGAGNVAVTALDAIPAANLSLITNSGTKTAVVSDTVIFTGDLGTFTTTVAATKTFSATAAVVTGKTITGAGNVDVAALELTAAADLHLITSSGTKTAAFSGTSLTFTGNLGTFATTVDTGQTFTAAASVVNGKTIGGPGTVQVDALEATSAADLHLITTATKTATVSGNVTFTGNLGTFTTTVAATKIFTATAAVVTGQIIITDTGTVAVTALELTDSADLSQITKTSTGHLTAAVSGNVTFIGNLGTFTTTVAANKTFTADADKVDGHIINGAGNVAVTALNAIPAANLSLITNSGTKTAVVSDTVIFTGDLGTFTTTVASGQTFTADAAVVDGKIITGAGNVEVAALESTAAADLHLITSSGTKTAAFSGTSLTFTGNLGTFTTTVDTLQTFTAAASVVNGKIIEGAGDVAVTALNATASADLSLITTSAGALTALVSGNVTFTGNLGTFTTTVASGQTFTATAAKVSGKAIHGAGTVAVTALQATTNLSYIDGSGAKTAAVADNITFIGNLGTFTTLTVAAAKTFTATAAVADGKTITGTGNIAVTALDAIPAANLSLITNSGTKTAVVSDNVTFTGNLGTFTTTVNTGQTFTADAAVVHGKIITGAGNVAVTALNGTLNANLSNINNGGAKTAEFAGSLTFTGNLGGFTTTVSSGTFTATAAIVSGKTITGAGIVAVTALEATTDLSHIGNSGAKTAAVADNITFIGNLGLFNTLTVAATKTLTATAAVVDGKTITGSGAVAVTALETTSDADLSGITNSGTKTATVSGNVTFTGNLGTFITTVADDTTFTADAAVVTTKYIDGAGNVAVTALNATAGAILSHITNSGTKTATVSDDVTFTGDLGAFITTVADDTTFTATAAVVTTKYIDGAGNVAVTALNATPAADLRDISNTGDQTAAVSSNVTFTGDLGTFTTTVDGSSVFTATAAKVDGKIITITDTGTVAVTALNTTSSADLSQITNIGTGHLTAAVSGTFTFTGDLGTFTTTVGSSYTFTAASAKVTGKTIGGAGNVAVTALEATADLSHIGNSGTKTAAVSNNITFIGNLGSFTTLTVATDKTFTTTAANVDGKTITGGGDVEITALNATPAANLSNITNSGTKTAEVSDDVTFTGDLGGFTTTVAEPKTFTATAAVVDDKIIDGLGGVAVTALNATMGADLRKITAQTVTATASLVGNQTLNFVGNFGKAAVTITGTGAGAGADEIFNIDGATLGTATFSVIDGATLQGSADTLTGLAVSGNGHVDVTSVLDTGVTNLSTIDVATLLLEGTGNADTIDVSGYAASVISIVGGAGNDALTGGSNDDYLTGGSDSDVLTGGGGNDTFIFNIGDSTDMATDGFDYITDLSIGDHINLTGINGGDINFHTGSASDQYGTGITLTSGFDVFFAQIGGADYLFYETTNQGDTAADAGNLEVVNLSLVGTQSEADGIITIGS